MELGSAYNPAWHDQAAVRFCRGGPGLETNGNIDWEFQAKEVSGRMQVAP
jgi:hypothetical protein